MEKLELPEEENKRSLAMVVGIALLTTLLAIGCFVLLVLYHGWAVMLLWNWFVPLVTGLGTITIGQAIGISVLAKALTLGPVYGIVVRMNKDEMINYISWQIGSPIWFVGVGYLVTLFLL